MKDKIPDDIVDLVIAQHQEAKKGMAEVSAANLEHRLNLFDALAKVLTAHALAKVLTAHEAAERAVIYPTLRQLVDSATAMVKALLAQEDEGKAVLARLQAMDTSSDEFGLKFEEFRATVLEHDTTEEVDVVPLLCAARTKGERTQMTVAFAAARA